MAHHAPQTLMLRLLLVQGNNSFRLHLPQCLVVACASAPGHFSRSISTTTSTSKAAEAVEAEAAAADLQLRGITKGDLDRIKALSMRSFPDDEQAQIYRLDEPRKRLTYGDIPAADALAFAYEGMTGSSEPIWDPAGYLERNYPRHDLQPRSPYYHWRSWMQENLPVEQQQLYIAFDEHMQDNEKRAYVLKHVKHEITRLWHWQRKRIAAGLPADLPPSAAYAAAETGQQQPEEQAVMQEAQPSSSSSSTASDATADSASAQAVLQAGDGQEASSAAGQQGQQGQHKPFEKGVKLPLHQVLAGAGAFEPGAPLSPPEGSAAAPAEPEPHLAAVLGATDAETLRRSRKELLSEMVPSMFITPQDLQAFQQGMAPAQQQAEVERRRALGHQLRSPSSLPMEEQAGVSPGMHFLRAERHRQADYDGKQRGKPMYEAPLDEKKHHPDLWEVMLEECPQLLDDPLGATPGYAAYLLQARHARRWRDMGLLDRGSLQQQQLGSYMRQFRGQLSSRKTKFQLQDDGYRLDLAARPPTLHLDLLVDYLEVKYADALMRREAVAEVSERMQQLEGDIGGGGGRRRLSPAEVAEVNRVADELFAASPGRYIEYVQQLGADGVLGPGEMLECVAAAEARMVEQQQQQQQQQGELVVGEDEPVTEEEREQLLALLQGGGAAAVLQQQLLPAAAAGSPEAQQLWEEAGKNVAGSWQEAATSSHLQGLGGKGQLQQLLSAEVPAAAARQLWQQYVAAAGCEGSAPSFDELLLLSKQAHVGILRQEDAEKLQQQLAELQRQYALRNLPEAMLGEQPAAAGAAAAGLAELVVQGDVQQVVGRHLQRLQQQFGLGRGAGNEGEGAGGSILQTLQPLAALISRKMRSGEVGGSSSRAAAAAAAISDTDSDDDDSDDSSAAGQDSAWADLLQRVDSGALMTTTASSASASPAYLQGYGMAPGSSPPPYPGARKLLRWQQTMMLHAAAALAEHPLDRVARLTVNAAELQREVGLSGRGLQHVLRVCGKRYNRKTGDIKLVSRKYGHREENRRWCLEVLHRLVYDGQARHPAPGFLFDRLDNLFAPTEYGPGA